MDAPGVCAIENTTNLQVTAVIGSGGERAHKDPLAVHEIDLAY
jgi:hypothetical protein